MSDPSNGIEYEIQVGWTKESILLLADRSTTRSDRHIIASCSNGDKPQTSLKSG